MQTISILKHRKPSRKLLRRVVCIQELRRCWLTEINSPNPVKVGIPSRKACCLGKGGNSASRPPLSKYSISLIPAFSANFLERSLRDKKTLTKLKITLWTVFIHPKQSVRSRDRQLGLAEASVAWVAVSKSGCIPTNTLGRHPMPSLVH